MSVIDRLVYSRAAGAAVLGPIARWGHRRHLATGETPRAGYRAMRKLYGSADAGQFASLAALGAAEHQPLVLPADPAGLAHGVVDELVASLRTDGFVVMPGRLPEPLCADLEAVARAATCRLVDPIEQAGAGGPAPATAVFDPDAPLAVRYEVPEEDAIGCAAAQQIVADASLLAVAQEYLGSAPVQDLVAMWWSAAVGAGASSAAAQQFHFDLDRLRFLKFFVFLTDVDEQTGPHVYARGSHVDKPAALRHDGRHGDAEVEAAYPGAVTTISGSRGTMFLADTIGLHKGLDLQAGHRLVFQTEWATSLFGAPFNRPVLRGAGEELAEAVRQHPWTYQRFELRPV